MSVERIHVTHCTKISLDNRFTDLMQKPLLYTIQPLPTIGYEWIMVRCSSGIIRGNLFPDRNLGNFKRGQYKRTQQAGNGRAPFRFKQFNNQGNNNKYWQRRNRRGFIQKRLSRRYFNGNFNRQQRQHNNNSMPSIQQLDEELDGYMAAGSSKTNLRMKLDRELENYMNMTAEANNSNMES